MGLEGRDIVSIRSLQKKEIEYLLTRAAHYEKQLKRGGTQELKGKILATLFFEPSTRTRISFTSAMYRLGGEVLGFADKDITSVVKGETLADTVRVVENYCDAIAIRHPVEGSAKLAADLASVPVINCGDGAHAHPTQTLVDLYTIQREKKKIKNLNIALSGDLKYGRTVHSLSYALALFGANMVFVSPGELRMPREVVRELENTFGLKIKEEHDLEKVVKDIDVLYTTRIQKERFPDPEEYEKFKGAYTVDAALLEKAKKDMIVMHPLPRVDEITTDVDSTRHAKYFEQTYYSIPVRMALLASVLGVK